MEKAGHIAVICFGTSIGFALWGFVSGGPIWGDEDSAMLFGVAMGAYLMGSRL